MKCERRIHGTVGRIRRLAVVAAGAVLCLAPTVSVAQSSGDHALTWRGCDESVKAFMEACVDAYQRETGTRIRLSGGGTALAVQAVAEGGADLGCFCRPSVCGEVARNAELRLAIIAWDVLCVVVHPDNPIESITRGQLLGILTQRITDWRELAASAGPIVVVARTDRTSGIDDLTRMRIMDNRYSEYGASVVRLRSSVAVEKIVEKTPNAMALTSVSSARRRALKIVAIDGNEPTSDNIASGRYPYIRPLYMTYADSLSEDGCAFLNWLLGPEGQAVVVERGTVNLEVGHALVLRYEDFGDPTVIDNYEQLVAVAEGASSARLASDVGTSP